ncbi:MAG TPA: MBL fold metallo-hydrolase [Roseiflexaceae bacterium]|nr:MBL fold metallo-hydrolase [Roseiflexaceae bacterium]
MTDSSAGRTATPTAFPAPGVFGVTQRITLLCDTPGATIHYTLDGSTPDQSSPAFDTFQLPVLEAIDDGERGVSTAYILKALAVGASLAPSEVATFNYQIDRRDKDTYLTAEVSPGIHMIRDFDDTKMYLVIGSQRALLVDAGLGTGNLRALVESMIGDRPLDVVITHGHPDHVAAMGQFQDRYDVRMNHRDLPLVQRFVERLGYRIDLEQIDDLHEGASFDLGDRSLTVYEVPGHSPGHTVLFDEANGILLASDAVGSNRSTIPDSLWMQMPGMGTIDDYLSSLQVFRSKVAGKIRLIYGGHNDVPFVGEAYLDNLERAAQMLVDAGEEVLVPSLRPTDAWQVVIGDRLEDPNWAAINVAKGHCLSVPPDQIATLSNLQLEGAQLDPPFNPHHDAYTVTVESAAGALAITPTATSSRHQNLTIDGVAHQSGSVYAAQLGDGEPQITIAVTSPDGTVTQQYSLAVRRMAASQ